MDDSITRLEPGDAGYPTLLAAIATPPALDVRGAFAEADALAIAIVGSRQATAYGMEVAESLAGELGREVFAVPGRITSPASRGAHGLLKDGAKLVGHWSDIVAELSEPWRSRIAAAGTFVATMAPPAPGSDEERMLEQLTVDEPQHIEHVIARAEIDAARAGAALTTLELTGWARQLGGQRWVATVARARRA